MPESDASNQIELRRLKLEESRFRSEMVKWIAIALGAVASFYVVDVGKLRLEEFKTRADNQRALLTAYLTATESVQPDVWKRKLRVLETFSDDQSIREWAKGELQYIDNFAARDALYRETLRVASQLVSRPSRGAPGSGTAREAARARFEQLYWADLPFVKESQAVVTAMINFRQNLRAAESSPDSSEEWDKLNRALINLSEALRESLPQAESKK